jgi:hypothetical protein
LQNTIQGNISQPKRLPNWAKLAALATIGVLGGIAVAATDPLADPLGPNSTTSTVPKEPNVEAQLEAAYWGTFALRRKEDSAKIEEYSRAVVDYFPLADVELTDRNSTEIMHCRAMTRLGELHLAQGDLEKAKKVFDWLAERDEQLSLRYSLMGTAGQAVVYDRTPLDDSPNSIKERGRLVRSCLARIGGRYDLLHDWMRELNVEDLFNDYPPES